ncbi:MAG TPA: D-alanyl-D-alanine carboxypeptidase family protein [Bacillota bacterium]
MIVRSPRDAVRRAGLLAAAVLVLALAAAAPSTAAAAPSTAAASVSTPAPAAVPDPPHIDARAAVLIDADSGRVLHAYNAETPLPMASTTKIMTGWLLAEMVAPDTTIWVPFEARGVAGSKIYLEPGERYPARDMLLALMIESANDAAVAVAVNLAGSVEDFAALMNRRAEELGLEHTHFVNPHGLDAEGHYASALDLARLARAAMSSPAFREAVALPQAVIAHPIAGGTREIHSHNRFLVTYPGATGIKTGFTNGAGFSLVGGARRDGVELIGVILGGDSDVQVARQMGEMMDWAFASFEPYELVTAGERIVLASSGGSESGSDNSPESGLQTQAAAAQGGEQVWLAAESLVTLLPRGEAPAEEDLSWRVDGRRLEVFYRGQPVGSVALEPEAPTHQVVAESADGRSAGLPGRRGPSGVEVLGTVGVVALGVTLWAQRRRSRRRRFSWQPRRDGWGPRL